MRAGKIKQEMCARRQKRKMENIRTSQGENLEALIDVSRIKSDRDKTQLVVW